MKRLLPLVALFALLAATAVAQDKPLNLLIITADDMNGDSPGWMGNPLRTTPHLDAFSITANQFINHHVTAPICQPSRSALMTGRVPHASGALGFDPVNEGVPSLVKILQTQGYFTGVIDKHAHMQPESVFPWDMKLQGSGKNPPLRKQHMEEMLAAAKESGKPFFINANITDPHRAFPGSAQENSRRAGRRAAEDNEVDGEAGAKRSPRVRQGQRAGKAAGSASPESINTRVLTDKEVRTPRFLENLPDIRTETAQYETAVARLDASFGVIMGALRESGHEDDTIVLFMSDHGISMPFSKATVYRNGTWSPLLLRIPGTAIPQVRQEFVSSVDILPTLLELLKFAPPAGLNGRSLVSLLNGQTQPDRDFVVTHVNTTSSGANQAQRCIRTRGHALLFHAWTTGEPKFKVEAMNGLTFKALEKAAESDARIAARVAQYRVGEPLMFFDEAADPDERTNLIDDPRQKSEIERLASLLIDHMQKTNDPLLRDFEKAMDLWRMQR
ncbi:Arylsulfatase [Caulifigura coniformis]|uniref:Arylsulfatase n=1 Tax=Caulifigura coniformis TaxID=2527983 RepID=A0A517S8W2_9PLAN|nr:sulfatase-like hydrolase/transferase [Caulifigura coniformis]QDT52574.1 Arylsulfatase [Caulifigura coniformis]